MNQACDRWFTRHMLIHYSTTAPIKFFVAFLGINQFCSVGSRFVCWFYDGTSQRLTGCGFMEKPGIEPVNPGLQGKKLFVAILGRKQFCPLGLRFLCWFYGGNTQRLTESGFMEKLGIELATPGLQGKETFYGVPGYKSVPLGWLTICMLVL